MADRMDHAAGYDEPAPETEAAKQARLAWEAERIAEALESERAGHVVSFEAVKAWIDSRGTPDELPKPRNERS